MKDGLCELDERRHFVCMNGAHGGGKQFCVAVPSHLAGDSIGFNDLVIVRIEQKDHVIGVFEDLAKSLLASLQRFFSDLDFGVL